MTPPRPRLNKFGKSCKTCRADIVLIEISPGRWRAMEETYMVPDPESTTTALGIYGETVTGHFIPKARTGATHVLKPHCCGAVPAAEKGATE